MKLRRGRIIVAAAASVALITAIAAVPFRASAGASSTIISNIMAGADAAAGSSYHIYQYQSQSQYQSQTTYQSSSSSSSTSNGTGATGANGGTTNTGNGWYAALGDSVAAGLGLPVADVNGATGLCQRSGQAYPYLIAGAKNLRILHGACSGATSGDLVTRQSVAGSSIMPQLDLAFSQGTPSLISITAGANDVHWVQFFQLCGGVDDCSNPATTAAVRAAIGVMQAKLAYGLADIQYRSGGTAPRTVITGYYNPVSNECIGKQQSFTNEEIRWLNAQRDALNRGIRSVVAQYPFARYASVNFSGHGICSSDPWVQGLGDPAPLHPTLAGQQAIGQAVIKAAQ